MTIEYVYCKYGNLKFNHLFYLAHARIWIVFIRKPFPYENYKQKIPYDLVAGKRRVRELYEKEPRRKLITERLFIKW